MKKFSVVIRTPEAARFEGEAEKVRVTTETGTIEVFHGHAPLAAVIAASRVIVRHGDHDDEFLVRNGTMFMDPVSNVLRILVQAADRSRTVDYAGARSFLDTVLARLDDAEGLSRLQLQFLEEEKIALTEIVDGAAAREKGAEKETA